MKNSEEGVDETESEFEISRREFNEVVVDIMEVANIKEMDSGDAALLGYRYVKARGELWGHITESTVERMTDDEIESVEVATDFSIPSDDKKIEYLGAALDAEKGKFVKLKKVLMSSSKFASGINVGEEGDFRSRLVELVSIITDVGRPLELLRET